MQITYTFFLIFQGVPTVTLGPTSDFPAFFSPKSGHRSTIALPTEQECASMIYSHLQSGLNNGIVIGVPIPEAYASETQLIENALDAALKESVEKQISGKDTTPFLLQRINELTRGVSLKANIALVKNNAAKGAQIAVHLSNLVKSNPAVKSKETNFFVSKTIPATAAASTTDSSSNSLNTPTTDSISSALTQSAATPIHHLHASEQPNNAASPASSNSLVVIGGSMIDVLSNITSSKSVMYSSNIAFVTQSFGGVGRNIAECAARLGLDTHLISAVGAKDMFSESLLAHANSVGVKTEHVARLDGFSAGVYNAVFDHQGGLIIGATDATAIENLPASNIVNSLDALFETTLSASSSASTSSESSAPSDSSSAESSLAESSSKTSLNKTPVFASPFRFDQSLATQPGRKQMLVCLDGNLSFEQLQAVNKKVLEQRESSGDPNSVLVWFEPTSVTKANKITPILPCINFASPNELELEELDTILHQIYVKQTSAASSSSSSSSTKKSGFFSSVFSSSSSSSSSSAPAKSSSKSPSVNLHIWSSMSTELQIMVQRAVRVSEWIPNLIVSIGADGKIVLIREGSNVHVKHYPANYGWCVQEHELASELVLQKQSKQQQETAAKDNTNTATTTTTTKEKGKDKEFVSSNISLSDLKDKPEADEEYEEIDLPIVNVTGAGDSSVAGIITTLLSNKSIDDAIKVGMRCSRLSLMSPKAISERVSPTLLLMKDIETQSLSSIL